jgi:hypothetical protein
MSWKKYVFANAAKDAESKENEKENLGKAKVSFENKFPSSGPIAETKTMKPVVPVQTATAITPNNPACAPHMDKIMNMYEKGFEGLNIDGFDFFEFFKMVVEGDVNNPQAYTMAFSMGKTMGATKETLLSQSEYYITEIQKVHQGYVTAGNTKRQQAIAAKTGEETELKGELTNIDTEIARLTALKSQTEKHLQAIDGKYAPDIEEIECKLMANNLAMEGIVGSIQKVVTGVKNNI